MSFDKYLKESRIIKRRTVAKDLGIDKRVLINGTIAKPSSQIKVSDVLEITLGFKILVIKVTSITPKKDHLLYELIEEKAKV